MLKIGYAAYLPWGVTVLRDFAFGAQPGLTRYMHTWLVTYSQT